MCAWIAICIVKGASPKLWLAFGVVAGIGLENKHTMLAFGFALVAGLLLTRERKILANRWLWLGGAIAFAIFLPNLIWEATHGWPQIEVVRNGQAFKINHITPAAVSLRADPIHAAGGAAALARAACTGISSIAKALASVFSAGRTSSSLPS